MKDFENERLVPVQLNIKKLTGSTKVLMPKADIDNVYTINDIVSKTNAILDAPKEVKIKEEDTYTFEIYLYTFDDILSIWRSVTIQSTDSKKKVKRVVNALANAMCTVYNADYYVVR